MVVYTAVATAAGCLSYAVTAADAADALYWRAELNS